MPGPPRPPEVEATALDATWRDWRRARRSLRCRVWTGRVVLASTGLTVGAALLAVVVGLRASSWVPTQGPLLAIGAGLVVCFVGALAHRAMPGRRSRQVLGELDRGLADLRALPGRDRAATLRAVLTTEHDAVLERARPRRRVLVTARPHTDDGVSRVMLIRRLLPVDRAAEAVDDLAGTITTLPPGGAVLPWHVDGGAGSDGPSG